MKKIAVISIFVFLTGLFAGLFFSTGLSEENTDYLSDLMTTAAANTSAGFFRCLLSSLVSNLSLAALMAASIASGLLCFLPFLLLWYKSFAAGFCSGLIYLSGADDAFLISLVKILPPNLFLLPAFIALAAATAIYSKGHFPKAKRPSREKKVLQTVIFISLGAITTGCIVEAVCHMISI